MVEIRTIGAGGGSLAHLDGAALRVGPASAGAAPGPACYLRGGTEPTVTDANLHLGLIPPDGFLGGQMQLSTDAAATAIGRISGPLGLSCDAAAAGIRQIASASMADAVRLSLFEKGADPGDFVLAAFGGAGGLHACDIAEELDIDRVIFPAGASTLSARGILMSDLRHDLMHSELLLAVPEIVPALAETIARLRAEADARLTADGVAATARRVEISADMRYRGQAFEINVPWDGLKDVDEEALMTLVAAFHRLHRARYAHSAETDPVEIVTLRAKALGLIDRTETRPEDAAPHAAKNDATRPVWRGDEWRETPVVARASLGSDAIPGPVVIEEDYSVLWIGPGWSLRKLTDGDLMAARDRGDGR